MYEMKLPLQVQVSDQENGLLLSASSICNFSIVSFVEVVVADT